MATGREATAAVLHHARADAVARRQHTIFGAVQGATRRWCRIAKGDTIETITIDGDTAALLKQMADQVGKWNNVLDKA
jgi:hypothetical protein